MAQASARRIARAVAKVFAKDRVTGPLWLLHHVHMSANIKSVSSSSAQYPELALFIDGEWLGAQGRKTQPVINPATEEVLGQLPLATPADLERALAAAQRAWSEWRGLLPVQRSKVLKN